MLYNRIEMLAARERRSPNQRQGSVAMNRRLRTVALCSALINLIACGREPWNGSITDPGQFYMAIQHDGSLRSYELHVPASYDGTSDVPLVFDLHPLVINGRIMELITDFQSLSDTHGFILVQPNGTGGSWNGGLRVQC